MPKRYTIGVDVGGTKISAGLVDGNGRIVARAKVPTRVKGGRTAVLSQLNAAIAQVWRPGVRAIGIGMAGSVDHASGVYRLGPNLPKGFRNVPIRRLLQTRFRVPVAVDNDVHCFVIGEAVKGAGRGKGLVVGVTLGTGIGGGIVMDGALLRGRHNMAGELGHMILAESMPTTRRRTRNSFENFSSGTALTRMYLERSGKKADAYTVETRALKGDRHAKAAVLEMQRYLVVGLTNILHTLDPDIIVIGGGISRLKALWKGLRGLLKRRVVYAELARTPVVKAKLGDDANLIGAALLCSAKN